MWTLAKMVKNQFIQNAYSRTTAEFHYEQWASWCFVSSLPHPLYPSSEAALKTNSPKTSSLGQVKNGLELSKNTTPRQLSLFDLSGISQESSIIRACLYLTWLRTCWMGSAIPLGLSSKTFRGDCLSSQLPGVVLPVGANKGLTKKLEKKPKK